MMNNVCMVKTNRPNIKLVNSNVNVLKNGPPKNKKGKVGTIDCMSHDSDALR